MGLSAWLVRASLPEVTLYAFRRQSGETDIFMQSGYLKGGKLVDLSANEHFTPTREIK